MAADAWTPLHEPLFLDIEVGIFCSILKIPSIPRDVSLETIPFTSSNFESMVPSRREQHAAGRFCLNSLLIKSKIHGASISESFPMSIQTNTDNKPISISHCDAFAVAVLALNNKMIGIDIESKCRTISTSILNQFCTSSEVLELMNAPPTDRLERWMVKEAVSKATGKGMSIAKEVTIEGGNAYYQKSFFRIIRHEYEGHNIVIVVDYSDSSSKS